MIAAIFALLGLLLGFMMYCCCVVAGRADRALEQLAEQDRANETTAENL